MITCKKNSQNRQHSVQSADNNNRGPRFFDNLKILNRLFGNGPQKDMRSHPMKLLKNKVSPLIKNPTQRLMCRVFYCGALKMFSLFFFFFLVSFNVLAAKAPTNPTPQVPSNPPSVPTSAIVVCYPDTDGDTFGDSSLTGVISYLKCNSGYVPNAKDCNDTDASINPNAQDYCDDDVDTNCDEDNTTSSVLITFYLDADLDGHADMTALDNAALTQTSYLCDDSITATDGKVYLRDQSLADDCDDTNNLIYPKAPELCTSTDPVDYDCDTITNLTDPDCAKTEDLDGDGYCSSPTCTGEGILPNDCNDASAVAHPGGTEICDGAGVDEDCDGNIDQADANCNALDDDQDGYCEGDTCADGSLPGDCDDKNAAISPKASEAKTCGDKIDNNCNGAADEGCSGNSDVDDDNDGFTELEGDCEDSNGSGADINPDADEVCDDGIDNNCDGLIVNSGDPTATCVAGSESKKTTSGSESSCACSYGRTPRGPVALQMILAVLSVWSLRVFKNKKTIKSRQE